MRAGKDEAPFAETRDVDVIGICFEASLLERLRDTPEGVASEHGRSALHNHEALRAEMARGGAIKRGGIELAEGIIRGIGKIDDDEIKTVGVGIDPGEGVGVDDVNARREKGFVVELGEHGMRGEKLGHFRIEIDEGDAFELEMAVEKKTKIIFEASEDEMLVACVAGENDVVGVDVVFGGGGDAAGVGHTDSEAANDDDAGNAQNRCTGELVGKQIRGPERDAGVDEAEKHGGSDQAETRHEENGKKQGSAERTEIIK